MNSDFDIEIGAGSGQGSYQVRVVHSGVDVESLGTLQLDVEGLVRRRDQLEATVLSSAVRARRAASTELPVRQVGEQLFRALFTGGVYGAYRASQGLAQRSGKPLRVVLRLAAPELAALPWETLFDPETQRYLCPNEPLVRHVPAPYTPSPLEISLPLRILGLVASPRNLPALDVEAEQWRLKEALAEPIAAGRVELVWLPNATWAGVHDRLLAGGWHALHFVGHGAYDAARDEGILALVGEDGLADMVNASQLASLLTQARPPLQLVVLNSCSSGEAGAHDLFSGTAAALAHSGITAVAAMQFAVSDKAAIAFARGFYTALAWGRPVDEAACSGRISILGTRDTLEWVTPVLYLRGGATQVFAFTSPVPPPPPPPVKIRAKAEHRALFVEARAESRIGHYDNAIGLLDDLLSFDPQYPDAANLRDTVRRSKRLADIYREAKAAEDSGDWTAAARAYAEILQTDPAYRDSSARKAACEARQRVADLQAELRIHAAAGQWQAVLDVDAERQRLDPSSADQDGLAAQARQELAAEPLSRPCSAETGPIPGQPFREQTTKMSFLWVPHGKFWMGSSKDPSEPNYDEEALDFELPVREVTLTDGFWIGEHPVTNAQYFAFTNAAGARAPEYFRKSRFSSPEQPVVGVDWEESRRFAQWLTAQAKLGDAFRFDLPTEAEWEYAARGSDGRKYPWGSEAPTKEHADYCGWISGPTPVGTHTTGRSPWGVQDMAGGVWEWCLDGWQENYAKMVTNLVNPCHLPASGAPRMVRGGSWYCNPRGFRCANRSGSDPGFRHALLGFRVVCRPL